MKEISFTLHARAMLSERSILAEWVERTISAPDLIEVDPNDATILRAFGAVPERGGRLWRLVYVEEKMRVRVITAFFDRSRKI
jgi:Domain of unknown function (DUF4258)